MRPVTRLLVVTLAALAACSRGPSRAQQQPSSVPTSAPEGTRSHEEVAAAPPTGGEAGPTVRVATPHPMDGGTPRSVRAAIGPVTRFQLVPVGEAALAPARATLDTLRDRYVGYGFELGAPLQPAATKHADCGTILTGRVAARGTLFVVAGLVACSTPFGAVNTALATGLVPLAPLGPPGPVSERRLTEVLASLVGELIGLSMSCTDGRACCALRKAQDLRTLDAQAAAPCPAHASELDRIREAAGMQ